MPYVFFDGQDVFVTNHGFAAYQAACATTSDAAAHREALLDLLYNEGHLCDVCGDALHTTHATGCRDILLCAACASRELGGADDLDDFSDKVE